MSNEHIPISIGFKGSRLFIENNLESSLFITVRRSKKNDPPMFITMLEPFEWISYFSENYCEYYIKGYNIINSGWDMEFSFDHLISYEKKDVLFSLDPSSEIEQEIWIKYISKIFKPKTQSNCYIKSTLDCEKITKEYDLEFHKENQEYFINYEISRDPTKEINMMGVDGKSPYEIINNALLRI